MKTTHYLSVWHSGVGKTSLGKSVAEALHRKYCPSFVWLVHQNPAHRLANPTLGAMSGRIIQNLQKAEPQNPRVILDEIDKVTNDFKGHPASALLEVLDPEQNNAFHDNYLDIDYDLSKVMFIATANNLNTISQPLLDRMELSTYRRESRASSSTVRLWWTCLCLQPRHVIIQ